MGLNGAKMMKQKYLATTFLKQFGLKLKVTPTRSDLEGMGRKIMNQSRNIL